LSLIWLIKTECDKILLLRSSWAAVIRIYEFVVEVLVQITYRTLLKQKQMSLSSYFH